LTQTTRYAAVLAKIGAERSSFLNEAKLKTFADSKNLTDFAAQLRDTAYQEQISKIQPPLTGRKLERAFNENLIETYRKIIKHSPKAAANYLNLYLLRFEIENIKTLIKGTIAGLTAEQKLSKTYPFVSCYIEKRSVFEEAAKASSLSQLVATFKKTPYASPLDMGLESYNESGSTTCLDVFLDAFFYEHLYRVYNKLPKREKPHALPYASLENDSYILLSILRGKNLNYDSNWLRLAVPHNYFNLEDKEVEAIISALNFEAAHKFVLNSYYAKYFPREDTPEETLAKAEKSIRKTVVEHAQNSNRFFFNIGLPLAYMTQKEAEAGNLRTLALGIDAAMEPDAIRAQLFLS
jgi:V/A-type H+-transporting ATPase subunit C